MCIKYRFQYDDTTLHLKHCNTYSYSRYFIVFIVYLKQKFIKLFNIVMKKRLT